jgi:hypothetical protein
MNIKYKFIEPTDNFSMGFKEPTEHFSMGFGEGTSITPVTSYNRLTDKPIINSVELIGSLSLPELGLRAIYYDTTENWDNQRFLISEEGAIYIYSDYSSLDDGNGNITPLAGIKIGDGNAYLIDMPFITDGLTSMLLGHIGNANIHITPQERAFWNNKVSSYMDTTSSETLVLSKTNYELEGEIYHG